MNDFETRVQNSDEAKERIGYGYFFEDMGLTPQLESMYVDDVEAESNKALTIATSVLAAALLVGAPATAVRAQGTLEPAHIVYQTVGSPSPFDILELHESVQECMGGLRSRIRQFGKLDEDWDDEGASSFSKETIKTANLLLDVISLHLHQAPYVSAPKISPLPDGSIVFDWTEDKKQLLLTVSEKAVSAQRWTPLESYESEGYWEISVDDVSEHLTWLLT